MHRLLGLYLTKPLNLQATKPNFISLLNFLFSHSLLRCPQKLAMNEAQTFARIIYLLDFRLLCMHSFYATKSMDPVYPVRMLLKWTWMLSFDRISQLASILCLPYLERDQIMIEDKIATGTKIQNVTNAQRLSAFDIIALRCFRATLNPNFRRSKLRYKGGGRRFSCHPV